MSFSAYDSSGLPISFKSTLDGSDIVPHHNLDKLGGKTPNYGAGAAGTDTLRTVTASDSPDVVALGAVGDAAVTNPASSGSVIALLKGLITIVGATLMGFVDGLETLIGSTNTKLDTLAGYLDGVEGKLDTVGTRAYGAGSRVAIGTSQSDSSAITATEVMLHATADCYVLAGSAPDAAIDGTSIPLVAGEKFHMRITSGHKISVIGPVATGHLYIFPVA